MSSLWLEMNGFKSNVAILTQGTNCKSFFGVSVRLEFMGQSYPRVVCQNEEKRCKREGAEGNNEALNEAKNLCEHLEAAAL